METDDLFKQEIRKIIDDEQLKKAFNLDARKYSHNYEGSMFFDSLNAGAKVTRYLLYEIYGLVIQISVLSSVFCLLSLFGNKQEHLLF